MREKLFKLWNEFWFSRFDPVSIGMFRIFIGIIILAIFLCSYANWDRFYGSDGIISLHDTDLARAYNSQYCIFLWEDGKISIQFFWWLGVLSSIAFIVGFGTHLATIILYVLFISMVNRDIYIVNGDDLVIRMLLFYSCFAPLGYSLSIDSWFRRKIFTKEKQLPEIWSIRAMQINVLLIYIISLPNKLVDDVAWINGQAIYYTVASNLWSRCPFPDLFCKWNCLLSKLSTYATILIEGGFPIFVWFKKTKLLAISLIAALQIGIAFLVPNVLFFTLAMVCSFWIFVPSEITYKILKFMFINPLQNKKPHVM